MAETKRVIYYDQLDNNRPTSGDVIFVDNPTTGTHKMDLKSFVDMINNGFDSSIKSSGVTVNADNYSTIITDVDNQPVNSVYAYGAALQSNISNLPSNKATTIVNLAQKSTGGLGQVMLAVERSGSGDSLYFRTMGGSPATWSSWVKVANNADIETDKTLSVDGKPADAKAAGDEINDLKADFNATVKPLYNTTNILVFNSDGFSENGITCAIDTTKNHVALSGVSSASITKNNIFRLEGLKPNTQYSIRLFNATIVGNGQAMYIFDGSSTLATIPFGAGGRSGVSFTTGDSVSNITTRLYIGNAQTLTNASLDIMAVEGGIPNTFVVPNEPLVAMLDDMPNTKVTRIIDNNFLINGSANRLNCRIGRFPAVGVLQVDQCPSDYYISIQGYDSVLYNNRTYDSGWVNPTHIPFIAECNPKYYYLVQMRRLDNGTIRDILPANDVVVSYTADVCDLTENDVFDASGPVLLPKSIKLIAHRGDDIIAPQNTAPSYIAARKQGFLIAENDVYGKVDNEYVMWHDPTLTRLYQMVDIEGYLMYTDGNTLYYLNPKTEQLYTYNNGYEASDVDINTLDRCIGANYTCDSFDYATLRRIDFGAYGGQKYTGTQIMTFREWVLLCKRLGMSLYIDHKMSYTNEDILALFEIVKSCGMIEHATWIGLNVSTATYLRTLNSDARIGILENPTQENVQTYASLNTDHNLFFNGNAKEITRESVQIGINAGFDVETWMVDFLSMQEPNVLQTINNALDYGVSGLTIDHYTLQALYPDLY